MGRINDVVVSGIQIIQESKKPYVAPRIIVPFPLPAPPFCLSYRWVSSVTDNVGGETESKTIDNNSQCRGETKEETEAK
jgi:hypothetical protein